jgi:predicted transcriptional regulator
MGFNLRDQDKAVLQLVADGVDDVQKITHETTLENHQVTYCFEKLEEHDLVNVEHPDGYVERVIDGRRRKFQAPKQAELTSRGEAVVEELDEDNSSEFEDMTHDEIVETLMDLKQSVESLNQRIDILKRQTNDRLDELEEGP